MRAFNIFCAVIMLALFFAQPEINASAPVASIFDQVDELKRQVEQENWEQALKVNEQISSWFTKNNWKLQFLSYESEYQEVERYISQLKGVIEERDKLQCKMLIDSLKSTLRDIRKF